MSELRKRMAAISGRADTARPVPRPEQDVLRVPGDLGDLLPAGGLVRGTMVACPRGAVLCALLAAVTDAGAHAAVVRDPRRNVQVGALAAWEAGSALDRLAFVDVTADRALEMVHVLAGGLSLIVLDMPDLRIQPHTLDVLRSQIQSTKAVLVATGGEWPRRPQLVIRTHPVAVTGLGRGTGRVQSVEYRVDVSAHNAAPRHARIALASAGAGHTRLVRSQPVAVRIRLAHTG
ncbi:hypothetical protein Ntsu_79670 [Nocardia sp. IFM 10818]